MKRFGNLDRVPEDYRVGDAFGGFAKDWSPQWEEPAKAGFLQENVGPGFIFVFQQRGSALSQLFEFPGAKTFQIIGDKAVPSQAKSFEDLVVKGFYRRGFPETALIGFVCRYHGFRHSQPA
jgi:hypothetical protein